MLLYLMKYKKYLGNLKFESELMQKVHKRLLHITVCAHMHVCVYVCVCVYVHTYLWNPL